MSRNEEVEISAMLVRETEAAYLIDDGDRRVWIPKSCCSHPETNLFLVPEWLAKDKDLI